MTTMPATLFNLSACLPHDRRPFYGGSPPHPVELLRTLVESGFHHATGSTALPYLKRCHRDDTLPDRQLLMRLLLSWPRAGRL